ncbi:MAG: hypothetical protein ACOC5D_04100 [Thermoplasmatota archaeon]
MNNRMIKVFSIVAIIFLLTVSLASVALANQAEEAQQGKSKAQQERAQNMARAAEKNWFGQFTMEDGTVDGRFVKFDYNETTGTISDYKVFTGETYVNVFDEVKINNFEPIKTSIQGAVFMMNGTHAKLMIHNNPRAIMQIVNPYDDTPLLVNYTVDENVDINEEIQPSAVKYSLTSDDLNGVINTPLNTTVEDDIITVNGEGWNETSHTMFMSKPSYTKEPKQHQNEFEEAVMNSKIGTEMEVVGKGEGHVSHEVRYRQNLQVQVQNMEEKKMRVRVQSEDPNGTCVMLRVEKQSLDIEENKLQMRLDGEKMKETSFQKVLEGGEQAKYSIQEQENGMLEIAVNVPHFSEHEITVESASETPGYTLPLLLTAVGVVGVIWAVRKKRN